jgi:hypothetical protein
MLRVPPLLVRVSPHCWVGRNVAVSLYLILREYHKRAHKLQPVKLRIQAKPQIPEAIYLLIFLVLLHLLVPLVLRGLLLCWAVAGEVLVLALSL